VKPIRVLLLHRDEWYRWLPRIDGGFAYEVPQFIVDHHVLPKAFKLRLDADLPIAENGNPWPDVVWLDEGKFKSHSAILPGRPRSIHNLPPVVQHVLYPTLTDSHYRTRLERAKANADLVLLDHDDLDRWRTGLGKALPARRFAYSVNERFYCDQGLRRDIDVGFYCVYAFNRERPALDKWLEQFCERKGWHYGSTYGKSVGPRYARLLARTKVVVHLNRTPATRPPRIFDCGATGTALLSNPMPQVSGEYWEPWVHYAVFEEPRSEEYRQFKADDIPVYDDKACAQIAAGLEWLLEQGNWERVAANTHERVLACHTWRQRAAELYAMLLDEFPQLREEREEWWYQSP